MRETKSELFEMNGERNRLRSRMKSMRKDGGAGRICHTCHSSNKRPESDQKTLDLDQH